MKKGRSKVYKLEDYKAPYFLVTHVDLEIDLSKKPVQSKASLTIIPNPNIKSHPVDLVLDGENLVLTSISLDGKPLKSEEYELTDESITIKNVPNGKSFTLSTSTLLGDNTDLFGLYETEGTFLVKAETEGLRRVLFCNDRPDNLATYKTTIIADKEDYPVLLSNGQLVEHDVFGSYFHSTTWVDDVPKPSYLFALVAGKLQYSAVHYKTQSGRVLPIEFYVPPEATAKCDFAKEVLLQAMAWDEKTYQLECALPKHMVAGVEKFAAGASESTGLNLFNTENLFATPESKTDLGILRVLAVVAHEFFHYWSGNRVTIRDWHNLSFKEGLTTFRENMFLEDLLGGDLVRLLNGKNLDERAPRQSSYTEVRSLYTAAAYEKSADIFRMIMLTVGKESFYKGMTKFLKENDGNAVTLENVLDSLSVSTGINLNPFLSWFTKDGIPEVIVTDDHNPATKKYTLKINTKNAAGRPIPFVMGLLDSSGKEIIGDKMLMIDQPEMEFHFDNISSKPTPSLLRSFSAPVTLTYNYTNESLLLLIQNDPNLYNRCEAATKLITRLVTDYCDGKAIELTPQFFDVYRSLLTDKTLSEWMLAELLTLPSEEFLAANVTKPIFEKLGEARLLIQKELARELKDSIFKRYNDLQRQTSVQKPQFTIFDIKDAGSRRLKAVCYSYLQWIDFDRTTEYLLLQFRDALGNNMTETISALTQLCDINYTELDELLNDFYLYWQNDASAINYWFNVQAAIHSNTVVNRVAKLMQHPAFDLSSPNKVYALLGSFIKNPYGFHAASGEGYDLLAKAIISLDEINPTLAANLTGYFINWNKYDDKRQKMMLDALVMIHDKASSPDVRNTAKKGLDKAKTEPPLPIHLTLLGGSIKDMEKKDMKQPEDEMTLVI
ncbi:aminopeptidase N [Legionella maioricensis]|uniref:Aminopeptidase N n=1 Tax=Legionella maioricensis TaxID=2896528 RepID=A0A9X2D540_9GAMM|nr:aminopeptidase N [Legionella maioricensis]MCL9685662.1 aminopeptidase N [Legionella maioricensis]MCL9689072.1 aminopeptidase N [Legionella maioricensis]